MRDSSYQRRFQTVSFYPIVFPWILGEILPNHRFIDSLLIEREAANVLVEAKPHFTNG